MVDRSHDISQWISLLLGELTGKLYSLFKKFTTRSSCKPLETPTWQMCGVSSLGVGLSFILIVIQDPSEGISSLYSCKLDFFFVMYFFFLSCFWSTSFNASWQSFFFFLNHSDINFFYGIWSQGFVFVMEELIDHYGCKHCNVSSCIREEPFKPTSAKRFWASMFAGYCGKH